MKPSQMPDDSRGRSGWLAGVPAVEVADDGDVLGRRGPDGEVGAGGAVARHRVGAELLVEAGVRALVEQVQVLLVAQACHVVRNGLQCRHPRSPPGYCSIAKMARRLRRGGAAARFIVSRNVSRAKR